MSGYAGLGKGIADAGQLIGSMMLKSAQADEDRNEKLAARREELLLRLADRQEAREQNAALRMDLAEMKGGGKGGGGGGLSLKDIGEGGAAEGVVARELGVDVPTLRALRRASETGDKSAFMQDKSGLAPDQVGPRQMDYPPGFDQEFSAKMKALARIEQRFAFGKDYESTVKGQREEQKLDVGNGILNGEMGIGKGAGVIGALDGKDQVSVNDNTVVNKFTGQTKPTGNQPERLQDLVATANGYRQMADSLRRAAADELNPKEQERLTKEADSYTKAAKELFDAVKTGHRATQQKSDPAPGGSPKIGAGSPIKPRGSTTAKSAYEAWVSMNPGMR